MRRFAAVSLFLLSCATHPPPLASTPAPKCPSIGAQLGAIDDPDLKTIDVVIYYSEELCIRGDARHLTVLVDERQKQAVELPCVHDLKKLTITAPPPRYDGGKFVVDAGTHDVRVVDDDK